MKNRFTHNCLISCWIDAILNARDTVTCDSETNRARRARTCSFHPGILHNQHLIGGLACFGSSIASRSRNAMTILPLCMFARLSSPFKFDREAPAPCKHGQVAYVDVESLSLRNCAFLRTKKRWSASRALTPVCQPCLDFPSIPPLLPSPFAPRPWAQGTRHLANGRAMSSPGGPHQQCVIQHHRHFFIGPHHFSRTVSLFAHLRVLPFLIARLRLRAMLTASGNYLYVKSKRQNMLLCTVLLSLYISKRMTTSHKLHQIQTQFRLLITY